jgi:hypothetical protein
MPEHHLTAAYIERLSRFAVTFPAAHTFLRRLEIDGPEDDLWLSTATNAHLYKGDGFLAYLKLNNPELQPPSLVISPRFNQMIAAHTTDESARLFPKPFDKVVMNHSGFKSKWAVRRENVTTELTVATPAAFFEDLYAVLRTLDVSGAGQPAL